MTSLFRRLSRNTRVYLIVIIGPALFSAQAYAQHEECSPSDSDKDWAQMSTYTDENCNVDYCNKEVDAAISDKVQERETSNKDVNKNTSKYETQVNEASRSLERRKTNTYEEDEMLLEESPSENESVNWRWEGKDKL